MESVLLKRTHLQHENTVRHGDIMTELASTNRVEISILNVSNKKLPANCAANHTMNHYVAMDTSSLLPLYKQREIFLHGNRQETRLQMKLDSWHAKPT